MRKHNKVLPGRHCRWRVAQTKTNIDKPTTTTRREQGEGKQEAVGDGGQPARQGETNPTDMAWVVHDVVGVAAAGYRGVRPGQKAGEKEAGGGAREIEAWLGGRLQFSYNARFGKITNHDTWRGKQRFSASRPIPDPPPPVYSLARSHPHRHLAN